MTVKELNKRLERENSATYNDSCYKTKLEVVKRIVTSKVLDEETKYTLLNQYVKGTATNEFVIKSIKEYQNR